MGFFSNTTVRREKNIPLNSNFRYTDKPIIKLLLSGHIIGQMTT